MMFTEQAACLTGGAASAADREHGTAIGPENLDRELALGS